MRQVSQSGVPVGFHVPLGHHWDNRSEYLAYAGGLHVPMEVGQSVHALGQTRGGLETLLVSQWAKE